MNEGSPSKFLSNVTILLTNYIESQLCYACFLAPILWTHHFFSAYGDEFLAF